MSRAVRILGIDPGSRVTGFGLIDAEGPATRYVASGCIRTDSAEMAGRLRAIYEGVRALVVAHEPQEIAVEKVFMHRNADSALKLGQARAAAICATFAREADIHEYAARAVKQAIVGRGGAEKGQVGHMVRALLRLPQALAPDEADALAVALCHAHSRPLAGRIAAITALRVVRR
jgi:crossover junction endodeoxyribonuclease RuvC